MLEVLRLFWSGVYFRALLIFQLLVKQGGENKENSELSNKKDKYKHCELLCELGFKNFPTLKL